MNRGATASVARHAVPLALFAALTIGWTWPLVLHVHDSIPGDPGDNYSFLWYLWWMRHVLASPGAAYFRTDALFHPFGASIANNPHTALPAFVAATVLGRASIITAQNLLLLSYVFLNMAVMYALAFDVTADVAAATAAAVVFGLSPYVAVHFPGHFELMTVWTLPAFALFFRRACARGSIAAGLLAGGVAVATAYTSYYYFVYQALFAAAFLVAWSAPFTVTFARREDTRALMTVRLLLVALVSVLLIAAAWIAGTGGASIDVMGRHVSATTPQNALTLMWIAALTWVLLVWQVHVTRQAVETPPGLAAALASTVAVVAAGVSPLVWQGVRLMQSGEYVTPVYFWRSAPRGVDALAPLLGHPAAVWGAVSARAYAALHLDPIEAVGWLGLVAGAVLIGARPWFSDARERRAWMAVAIVFAVWAAGPFLTIGGVDSGLKLPEILVRWIPFVANARMPGRATVGVYLALAVAIASALEGAHAHGKIRSGAVWAIALLVVVEMWDAPIRLTMLDRPEVYRVLAAAPPGAVCEVPFGVGDGLSAGAGSQDRRVLYYATLHEHPLVGGYLGRMPTDVDRRYASLPVVGTLLRLSDPDARKAASADETHLDGSPCTYLVVDRAASSPALLAYVDRLPSTRLASAGGRDLLRLQK